MAGTDKAIQDDGVCNRHEYRLLSSISAVAGDTGKFLYSLPIVISFSLLAALLVSMTFVPLISSFLLQSQIETPIEERRQRGFTGWYFRTAKKAIEHRKLCLAGSLVLLIAGGVVFSRLKPQFFPKDLQYFSYIDVWLPEDTPASATSTAAQQVESITRRVAEEYGKATQSMDSRRMSCNR